MRPVHLTLEGFGSYTDPTDVDFTTLGLVAITGPNGAGKSTLWDAITYALFGTPRVPGDVDSVVSLGDVKATVQFSFDVEGELWRVTRIRVAGKRTQATIEAQTADGDWEARSDASVRGTDEAIRELLGMGEDTFASTVMVGQGEADRFSAADPAARKQILAEVLDLSRFSDLAEAARGEVSTATAHVDSIRSRIDDIDRRLVELGDPDALLVELDRRHTTATAELAAATAEWGEIQTRRNAAAVAATELAGIEAQIAAELADLEQRRRQATGDLADARTAHARAVDARTDATGALRDAVTAADTLAVLTARRDEAQVALADTRVEQDRIQGEGQELAATHAGLLARLPDIDARRTELAERLIGVQRDNDDDVNCWVCDRPFDVEHRSRIIEQLTAEQNTLAATRSQVQAEADATNNRIVALRVTHKELRARVESLDGELRDLTRDHDRCDTLAGERPVRTAHLEQCEADLTRSYTTLERCEAETNRLADDPESVGDLTARLDAARDRAGSLTDLDATLNSAQTRMDDDRTAMGEIDKAHGRAESAAEQVTTLRCERTAATATIDTANQTAQDWQTIAKAFNRDGVPAMILEGVMPELEEGANTILERLSAGDLQVRLDTTRATKSGSTRDTLDITVSTSEGDRRYESLSGGEALRVDLALRLGLARLLANRAGRNIRFVVIDEGWGALDTDGTAGLVDMLRTLHESGEFDLVATVTHVDTVAAAFPQQLVVTRDGTSSTIEVNAA
jgi:exonuclease SbcC